MVPQTPPHRESFRHFYCKEKYQRPFLNERSPGIGRVGTYLERCLENGNVNRTARRLHISTCKLELLFRQVVGYTVLTEIQNRRYWQVVRILYQTDHPIREIVEPYGLKNVSRLIQKFKERFGTTITQFRTHIALDVIRSIEILMFSILFVAR